jgi:hypothetical protein
MNSGVEIFVHALDLGLPPQGLIAQVVSLADDIVALGES